MLFRKHTEIKKETKQCINIHFNTFMSSHLSVLSDHEESNIRVSFWFVKCINDRPGCVGHMDDG